MASDGTSTPTTRSPPPSPSRLRSPPQQSHSRNSSTSSLNGQSYRPPNPSGLRQAHMPPSSPEDRRDGLQEEEEGEQEGQQSPRTPGFEQDGIHPYAQDFAFPESASQYTRVHGEIEDPPEPPNARSRLLENEQRYHVPHNGGQYKYRPRYQRGYGSIASSYAGSPRDDDGRSINGYGGLLPPEPADIGDDRSIRGRDFLRGALGDAVAGKLFGKPSKKTTSRWMAKKAGRENSRWVYIRYYIPSVNWISQYRTSYLFGDLTAAFTMASFYIPMSLSYASNLGHVPPISGLYSFVFNPLIYALLGTCPQMVVGPEAAGSLLTGSVVKEAIKRGTHFEDEDQKHAQVAGMVTGLAGGIILLAGLCRLGFLDGVLSRPFLRGFISAIGIVILVDQLIPEMGLNAVAHGSEAASHGSSLEKILFLFRHGHEAHKLTCIVSFTTIAIVLVLRELKRRLQPRMSWVAYIPDRFAVVVLSAIFAWKFDWENQGLALMGDIRSKGRPFKAHFPFDEDNFKHVDDAFSTAFIIALLGFFESSVAAKSLRTGGGQVKMVINSEGEEVEESDGIKDMTLSANRELVALGVANLFGGLFMALPGFGGYGRSKVNASTGGKTPMSSIFLALITLMCILFLMPYFYYIPKGTLSAMITVVAYSLIEEAPHDIHFFWQISGYSELILMTLIFLATFLWNLKIGIAVGIGLSLLRLLRHSTRPRIQILGRVPGTKEFENVESDVHDVEKVPHCLIVKIPEPLTFANTGSLKDRLRRVEDHGTANAHPALPKLQKQRRHNKNIVFDIHGVTSMDPAAVQVLLEIVQAYVERGTKVFFCRVPGRRTEVRRLMEVSGIVELCGGEHSFYRSVDEALRATERSSTLQSPYSESEAEEGVQVEDEGAVSAPMFEEGAVGREERRVGAG
ncbi:hypothetical protein LTR37_016329 [Vermiconidia calcicola]|uniref:Uncharacterized protein n=1 Tax=Vermiconidia calcicola TaxID=1690605 RepID=A0ACC3MN93_9PEZI|nr:hypothetical protein LTR37_016329 [Vermiconidia calcicola]